MPRTNAERQAAYRRRHLADINGTLERLNMLVSLHAKRKLERLAAAYGVTQRSLLERLLAEAEHALLATLPATAQTDYYEKRPIPLHRNGGEPAGVAARHDRASASRDAACHAPDDPDSGHPRYAVTTKPRHAEPSSRLDHGATP